MTRNTFKTIAALLLSPLAMLAASTVLAQDVQRPNYNFVELDYVYASADVASDNLSDQANADTWYVPEGAAIKGSVVLVEQLLLRGSYYGGKGEWKQSSDVNIASAVASIGWLAPTTDATGIDISLEYRKDDVELKGSNKFDEEVKGPGIVFGVRTAPWKAVELGLRAGWYEGDYNGAIGFEISGAWNIGDHWGVNLSWQRIDADVREDRLDQYELNQFGVGGRFYF